MSNPSLSLQGRGTLIKPLNPFHQVHRVPDPFHIAEWEDEEPREKTRFIPVKAKSIINPVDSPDLGFRYSANPYGGCEHGCTYCYARNSHTYWGFDAGLSFETQILVKTDAAALLEKELLKPSWKVSPVVLSGNTDCYQPAEAKFGLTREMLQVFLRLKHPVSLITKNALILRDLDLLVELARQNLVTVVMSITTLDEKLRSRMEPRTSTIARRLEVVRTLTQAGVPVGVMMAPIIPGLNDHEILPLAEKAAAAGALGFHYQVVRLNGQVAEVFADWIRKQFPNKAKLVLDRIASLHDGKLSDSRFHVRGKGKGQVAEMVRSQVRLARQKFFSQRNWPELDAERFLGKGQRQLQMFE